MSWRGWIAMLVALSLLPGCTLVGAGVGATLDASIPGPYDTRAPTDHIRFAPKERIMVWLANGNRVEGRYLGALAPTARDPETYLVIDAGERPSIIPVSEVKALGVERSGKGWLYGAVIGLAVDVTLVVVATIVVNSLKFDGLGSGGSGCWC